MEFALRLSKKIMKRLIPLVLRERDIKAFVNQNSCFTPSNTSCIYRAAKPWRTSQ